MQALASCNVFLDVLNHANDFLTAAAAGDQTPLRLLDSLLTLLKRLQPQPDARNQIRSSTAQPILCTLRDLLGGGDHILRLGEEHDAAEALELLMQALHSEISAQFHRGAAGRLNAKSALNTILHQQPPSQQTEFCYFNSGENDAVLQAWHSLRLPCEGLTAVHMQCVRCRHHFDTHYNPFTTLTVPLPLCSQISPLGVARVLPRASLVPCFDAIFGYEVVSGVNCPGCSIKASLTDDGDVDQFLMEKMAKKATEEGVEEGERSSSTHQHPSLDAKPVIDDVSTLQQLRASVEHRRPLPSELSVKKIFQTAGNEGEVLANYVQRQSQVTRRSVVSRWPPLLILHLRRTFWSPRGQLIKVMGHLTFPLRLALESNDGQKITYSLVSVVEHSGLSAGTGHYVAYRKLRVKTTTTSTTASTTQQQHQQQQQWVRVSDENVEQIREVDVLKVDAVLLFYEKQQQ